ncbi:MAG: FG-GAP-like repeat-containing protein [Candidatus Acidiferrum sp.]
MRLISYMRRLHQPLAAVLLSWLLACPQLPAQGPQNARGATADSHALVKPDPKRAKKLAELGAKAEAAGAYEQALAAYEEAARYAPFDVTIVSKGVALRSKLVRSYVDSAELLTLEGNLQGAVQQLAAAIHVDPSNAILVERLKQVEAMQPAANHLPPEEAPEGLPQVAPDKVTKNFHFQAELRSAYEQVAAAYGIKALFDPDLTSRNVKLRLEDVDFNTAMKVLTAETGTFWRAVNPKLILVAADTAEKRKAFEPEIEQTFALPASTTAAEMTEVVRAVRDLTGAQRIQQSLNAHSLTIRDTVPRVQLAGAIIQDLERARGEVVLEIDFLEVDRNNASKMGITPPSKTRLIYVTPSLASDLRSAPSLTALLTLLASVFGTAATGGLTNLASAIPPIGAIGGGNTTFLLTLPSASADFSQSLSLVHSGRQVLMRAQDGKPATFFLGERYPITLSLLSGSLGSGGLTPSVGGTGTNIQSEQFTVGQGPVTMVTADFRNAGTQDLAVLNQVDNSITILLNQGAGAVTQFAQATSSPISLGPSSSSASAGVVSPAATLTVTSATLQSIAVLPINASLAPGGTQQFTALGTFSDGSTQDITTDATWSTTNSTIGAIGSQTGLAVGQGSGATQVTATLGSVVSTAATLTGTAATLQSIVVTPATASISRNGTEQFTATGAFSDGSTQNVTASASWSSSNNNVATVGGGSGLARGISTGATQITAAVGGINSSAVALTVTSATLQSIAVTPANPTIAQGTSFHFMATGTYSDGSTQDVGSAVEWASSKSTVATIDASSGVAFGAAVGTTSITASQGGTGVPVGLAVGSVNSNTDSLPDLLVASHVTNTVTVLLGNGDGTFSDPKKSLSYVVGNQPSAIAVGTFNSNTDANLGFVVTNFADDSYSVFNGNGDGTFTQVRGSPFRLPAGATGPTAITVSDFDGDGKPDLAIVNENTNNVTVLRCNGDGTFKEFPKSPLAVGKIPVAIASGSLAGSTGSALAIANQGDNTVTVYLGNGDGTFVASSQSPLSTDSAPSGVVIADLVQQATGGIAVTNRDSGTVTVFIDLGSGLFTKALEPAAGTNPGAILAQDFTGGSFLDIVVANDLSGSAGAVTLLISPTGLISGSSIGEQAYPGSEYTDIGLKVKATPYLHENNEVTLQMDYEIKSLAGANLNGIPIISNRTVTQTIRLKVDETSIITGLLDREETKTLSGIPGLVQIPRAGYLFGPQTSSFSDDELLILITPRKLRNTVHESRTVYAGRGDPTGRGSVGTGAPLAPPPTVEPEEPRPENPPTPGIVPPGLPVPPVPQAPRNQENQPPPTAPPTRPDQ